MLLSEYVPSLVGGVLIGLAVTAMLFFNGRVTGVSGILDAALTKPKKEEAWTYFFLLGLVTGGIVMAIVHPASFVDESNRSYTMIALAGGLVGFGTVMGGGCTSGHGVCGISRLSPRSIVATLTFMLFGFLAVQLVKNLAGSAL